MKQQAHSQDFQKGGYIVYVYMHKYAGLRGSGGVLPQEISTTVEPLSVPMNNFWLC